MKKYNDIFKLLAIGLFSLLIAYFFVFLYPVRSLLGINDLPAWYSYTFIKPALKPFKIIGIAIDEHSLSQIKQRWPWGRSEYADILRVLDKQGVDTVGIDFVFLGESDTQESEGDNYFKDTLKNIKTKVVLTGFIDAQKKKLVMPLAGLAQSAYAVGIINTPPDVDGRIRRLRSFVELEGKKNYSFSILLAATYLNKNPENIVDAIPLLPDRTYFINYLIKPKDITQVSFSDCLNNLDKLKQEYGEDFLKHSLVLIYPEAEIMHDAYMTPIGTLPGGFLHLNGVVDILKQAFLNERPYILFFTTIISFVFIVYFLSRFAFFSGLVFSLSVVFLNFWLSVLGNLLGFRFSFLFMLVFCLAFYFLGSFYKYTSFLAQLLKIKDQATLDPLRNIYTLRYFYYRLALEIKKIYFRKNLYLIFIYLEAFPRLTEEVNITQTKQLWNEMSETLGARGKLWSLYSHEEVVGCVVCSPNDVDRLASFLKNSLEIVLLRNLLQIKFKLAYVKVKKNYPVTELLDITSVYIRKQKEDVAFIQEKDLNVLLESPNFKKSEDLKLIDTLGEDIEEKNRQLLLLIEGLNKEHGKTKESFFQTITSLVNALEARDHYTEGHSVRVSEYALRLVERLGWSKDDKEKLRKAALLHDLGKIGIPDKILHKPGPLTNEEYEVIRQHEVIGVKILEPIKEMSEVLPWILYHHERWDGKGYPHGLKGNDIPEAAQIISLADVYDALTTGRDYKDAFTLERAIDELVKNRGLQFNPRLTDVFVEMILSSQNKFSK